MPSRNDTSDRNGTQGRCDIAPEAHVAPEFTMRPYPAVQALGYSSGLQEHIGRF
jgi:hypothetical protein